ncbi:signal peptide peptidase SppA [Nibricoccus sp. IMCC34717]|uniref:signal peptide peptidase SppA n=1 Tax=Nibricoccus sp. IMCC34717 TaxID=3034021 RepID=UPI00384E89B9
MRNFLTSLLGTLAGLVLFFGAGFLCLVVFFAAIATSSQQKGRTVVEKGSYLTFDLRVNLADAPPPFGGPEMLGSLSGEPTTKTLQTRDVVRALDAAAKDPAIAGLFLDGALQPVGYGSGIATLREVRQAIERFAKAGKPVVSYVTSSELRDYYLCSAATEVWIDPFQQLSMRGLASAPLFYSGLFDKLGVGVQVTRVGRYKSAVEPFVRKDLSPEAREQLQDMLDELWTRLRSDIARTRQIPEEEIQTIADTVGILGATDAVARKLATRTLYRDEVIDELKARTGRKGSKEGPRQADLAAYIKRLPDEGGGAVPGPKPVRSDARIAVVYAEGAIVDGHGAPDEVGGERFAEELRRLREDVNVKAIVLRVNSPGGSALASEHMQRELKLAKAVKPVVVSMGSYAASGGYWISAYSDRIFAENTTITGSIGVFGVFFNLEKLSSTVGVTRDVVTTAKRADLMTASRPKTDEELAVLQHSVDFIYDEFIGKVAEARGLAPARVREIAEGRVWTGTTAVKLGLVDEIGGLPEAIAWAAQKAGVTGAPRIEEFPRRKGLNEIIAEALAGMGQSEARSLSVVEKWIQVVRREAAMVSSYNDPRGAYARLPLEISLQ